MKIIISPAKKMRENPDDFPADRFPEFLEDTKLLCEEIRKLSFAQARELWKCNDKLTELNFRRYVHMDLEKASTPAILAYEGLQYQHMAPVVFTGEAADYAKKHLRILSGFYGILRPFDRVTPYRLEMQAKAAVAGYKNLYGFWGGLIYEAVRDDSQVIINLASKEYAKCVERYLTPRDTYITCVFGEQVNGKIVQKGTYAKMARGEMVRFMAGRGIEDPEEIKKFDRLGYTFREEHSTEKEYVFLKE